jgi:N-formylglutamate deformylase
LSAVLELIRGRHPEPPQAALRAIAGSTPLVFDSPHSGTHYPADFRHACDLAMLRRAEDTHVEKLFGFAPALGIAWVEALFPRSYLDVNRGEGEIDLGMIEGAWTGPVETAEAALGKVRLGKGLVWKLTDEGVPLYDRKLSAAEVAARIARCWRPYHAALADAIGEAHARHGFSIHVNCHSMPSVAGSHATEHPGLAHPDFVIGDRDGTTASPRLAHRMAAWLRGRGYSVWVNHPYKGVEIVRRHGDPGAGRHSIQLEVNRRLYMDEATLELHAGSDRLQRHLRELVVDLLLVRASDVD